MAINTKSSMIPLGKADKTAFLIYFNDSQNV